ncbi:MAG: DUF423 domain-containing protein [Hyphomicrobium sp.]|jgi:uncharacterized membrane protein YgdD (TMEM256/DUF423 family)
MQTSTQAWAGAALLAYAGLAGAFGVGLAAAGAHGSDLSTLTAPAHFLIMHAAAAIALVAVATRLPHPGAFLLSALVLLVGVSLFSGDIAMRAFVGERLFPMAAPTGGTAMIVGWLMVALSGAWQLFRQRG